MWHRDFDKRLVSWTNLRSTVHSQQLPQCLKNINRWWLAAPWVPYYLHWDDTDTWPDPWQLLAENTFCDVARALGMLYTVALINRSDIRQAEIVQYDQGPVLMVNDGKYILNWDLDIGVNTTLEFTRPQQRLSQKTLQQKLF